jgi:hypothetical protein
MAEGKSLSEALLGAAEEYAIECAILKVRGSECLHFVTDEGVQIYGGMGYSEEAPMAGAYRDSRINRIFEGTNEINRMLSVDMLLKRAMKGKIDLMTPALAIQKEMTSMPNLSAKPQGLLAEEMELVQNMKKCFLAVAGMTVQNLMMELEKEQEILLYLSDIMSEIYICESAILRVQKLSENHDANYLADRVAMTQVYLNDAMDRVAIYAKNTVSAWAEGDNLRMLMMAIKRYTKNDAINTKKLRRQIAATLIQKGQYCFND